MNNRLIKITVLVQCILSLVLYFSLDLSAKKKMDLSRLDPHGPPNLDLKKAKLKQMIECRSCHLGKKDDKFSWLLKKDPYKLCVSCHNQYPHSGLVEHLGKKFKIKGNDNLSCLS